MSRRGTSLIEALVALVIAVVLMGAAVAVLRGSSRALAGNATSIPPGLAESVLAALRLGDGGADLSLDPAQSKPALVALLERAAAHRLGVRTSVRPLAPGLDAVAVRLVNAEGHTVAVAAAARPARSQP